MAYENENKSENKSDGFVTLGGLWKNTSKSGNKYLSGTFGFAKIFIFEVKNKTENGPDYRICIAENNRKEEGQD